MSKLQTSGKKAGSSNQVVPNEFIAALKNLLTVFLNQHGLENVYITLKIHNKQILKVKRSHKTSFTLSGETHPGDDQISIDLKHALNRLIKEFGFEYGIIKIKVEEGDIEIQPAPKCRV
ncbi:MAG: hypothetical protein ABSE63_10525 [Thermoguttaceae bacterium]|jgi:hypothetical protein